MNSANLVLSHTHISIGGVTDLDAILAAGGPWKRAVRIGGQLLIEGDCREVMAVLPKVDAVVTDAPFGISDAPIQGQGRTGKRAGSTATWFPPSDWDKCLDPAFGAVCEMAPLVAWFGQWRKREEVAAFMKWPLRAEIIWAKDCHVGPPCPVAARDERIWVFAEGGVKPATFETSVWDHPIIPTWAYKNHKNEKPVSLMARLIAWIGSAVILDPFMGSGTTLVACQRLGRQGIGIELDPGYFDTACKRVQQVVDQPPLFTPEPPKPTQEVLI
jgi:DNA modification methylase